MSSIADGASSPHSAAIDDPSRISQEAFKIGIGLFLGIALFTAGCRILARFHTRRRFLVDDGFFFLAIITLIASTALLYINIPDIYLHVNIQAVVLQALQANFIDRLVRQVKIRNTALLLLALTIYAVKFSFLFFFRALIQQQRKLTWWWRTVLIVNIAGTLYMIFSQALACIYQNKRMLVKCAPGRALSNRLYTSTALDIITDVFVISIPVIVLYKLRVNLLRKLALVGILCLSIFMMIIAIIRLTLIRLTLIRLTLIRLTLIPRCRTNPALAIFSIHLEGCVGVMVVSVSAFRALYVARQAASKRRRLETHERHMP